MVKIGLPWLLLVLMKLTNREIKSDEIISFQEVYDICQVEPNADICDILEKSPSLININKIDSPEKRRQKTVFSSWGGKRQSTYPYGGKRPAFSSWGGKRASDKHGRPKQTFSSWGGKRSEIDGYDNGEILEHQMEKRELNGIKQEDKINYRNKMTKGIHALFTIFSDWSRDPEEKKGIRYASLKSIRRSSDFFPWGGKRTSGNSE
ncbi:uncharacterized protein LOC112692411 [Sipha flava]|jgi:hypothetical protein|uniref:Uncharacterized protein LOC112692411 n=1 Tax=Sipha flava TaxID=143950 RepID=A0A2S2Q7U2_9HEMI|nr:uncharacterized protein LOC112692411 [Sipha flava]XP_025422868.1 uncharacterized protein LOC112692411 [Sipha flava]